MRNYCLKLKTHVDDDKKKHGCCLLFQWSCYLGMRGRRGDCCGYMWRLHVTGGDHASECTVTFHKH